LGYGFICERYERIGGAKQELTFSGIAPLTGQIGLSHAAMALW
jgi:hypothetical protein